MQILDILKIFILGVIEGITEWLPVSSTGHIMIVSNLYERFGGQFWSSVFSEGFPPVFDYVIQLGAIFAVVVIFFNKLFPFAITCNNVKNGEIEKRKLTVKKEVITLWLKVVVACLPAVVAIFIDQLFDGLDNATETVIIASTLIFYGGIFILVESLKKAKQSKIETVDQISYITAFLIGCGQVLAVIPGTSRSGITIIVALLLGVSRTASAEFTFFLAIPTMVGTSGFKILKFILDGGTFVMVEIWAIILGMVVSLVVSMLAIKFLMDFVKKHDFKIFGWYRIALGLLLILIFVF